MLKDENYTIGQWWGTKAETGVWQGWNMRGGGDVSVQNSANILARSKSPAAKQA